MIRIGAVILAAGAGMRLGGIAKAMLQLPSGVTFLEQISNVCRSTARLRPDGLASSAGVAHASDVVCVIGPPHGDEVARHARALGLQIVENIRPERGMASSVALGFAALAETECDAAWLWPVDHPDVHAETLALLVAALGDHDAARPVVGGRGGHPPLVGRALWPQLAACANLDDGARGVLARARTVDVAVDDPGCIRDVDTAIDLEALR